MEARLVAYAIPMFIVLIGIELLVARVRGVRVARFADAITDLGCGIASRIFHLFDTALLVGVYSAVFAAAAPWQLPTDSAATWIGAFVGVDLLYYWWHRASHGSSVLWAVHAVHHQSEDYNLSVALRQALFSGLSSLPFYLPLAVLGVPPLVFATCQALNTLYQFWIHTELVRTLPAPIEAVMNTASHHRVHHGINPRYLDRNHAGVFIVWDKLFGTFEPETEPVVYGLVTPLRSYNPLWANFVHFVELAKLSAQTRGLGDALGIWLRGPAWRPASLGGPKVAPEVDRARFVKYDPTPAPGLPVWISAWFLVVVVATAALMLGAASLPTPALVACALCILGTLLGWGGLLERRRWALGAQTLVHAGWLGCAVAVASGAYALPEGSPEWSATAAWAIAGWAVISGMWLVMLRPMAPPGPGAAMAGAAGSGAANPPRVGIGTGSEPLRSATSTTGVSRSSKGNRLPPLGMSGMLRARLWYKPAP